MMAGLLLGAALALPLVLSWVLRLGERWADRPLSRWFWADSRQQLPSLSLALMAPAGARGERWRRHDGGGFSQDLYGMAEPAPRR